LVFAHACALPATLSADKIGAIEYDPKGLHCSTSLYIYGRQVTTLSCLFVGKSRVLLEGDALDCLALIYSRKNKMGYAVVLVSPTGKRRAMVDSWRLFDRLTRKERAQA